MSRYLKAQQQVIDAVTVGAALDSAGVSRIGSERARRGVPALPRQRRGRGKASAKPAN